MSLFNDALTPYGYTRVKMTDIITALNTLWTTAFGADFDTDPRSPDGQIIGGLAEMFSDLEGAVCDTYTGLANPNAATGTMLTNIAGLNGLKRNQGMASYVPVTLAGTPSTVIPTTTLLQSTLANGVTAKWSNLYTLIPSTGAHTPGAIIGGGGTTSNVWAVCTVLGATKCPAGTPISILTVVSGLTSVTVTSDAVVGYLVEGDPNLRIRRGTSFGIATQGMADGLEAALNNLNSGADVAQAAVWENNTGVLQTFAGGGTINPHSIRVLVKLTQSGSATNVAQCIYNLAPPGCGIDGSTVDSTAVDEQGGHHTVAYDLATPLRVGVVVLVLTRQGWPSDGADQIASLVEEWASNPLNCPLGGNSRGELAYTDVMGAFLGKVPGFDLAGFLQLKQWNGSAWVISGGATGLSVSFNQYASIMSEDVAVTVL